MCFATSDLTISALYMYTATQDLFSLTGQEMMRKLFISHRRVSGMLELRVASYLSAATICLSSQMKFSITTITKPHPVSASHGGSLPYAC